MANIEIKVKECGMFYDREKNIWISKLECYQLKEKIEILLKEDSNNSLAMCEFFKELLSSNTENYLAFLSPVESDIESSGTLSPFQLLLGIPQIQLQISEIVLNQLVKAIKNRTTQFDHLPLQIISQFRWLPSLNDGHYLLNLIFEHLSVFSSSQKQEILMLMIDIFDQRFHDQFANNIIELVNNDHIIDETFLIVIIQTIGLLTLSPEIFLQVKLMLIKLADITPTICNWCIDVIVNSTLPLHDTDITKIIDFLNKKCTYWISHQTNAIDCKWMSNFIDILCQSNICGKLFKQWKHNIMIENDYKFTELDVILLIVNSVLDLSKKNNDILSLYHFNHSESIPIVEKVFKLLSNYFTIEYRTITRFMLNWCFTKDNTWNPNGYIACDYFYKNLPDDCRQYFISRMLDQGFISKDIILRNHIMVAHKILSTNEPVILESNIVDQIINISYNITTFSMETFCEMLRFVCYYQLRLEITCQHDLTLPNIQINLEELLAELIEKQLLYDENDINNNGTQCFLRIVKCASQGCIVIVETVLDFYIEYKCENFSMLNNCIKMYFHFLRDDCQKNLIKFMRQITKKIQKLDSCNEVDTLLQYTCKIILDRVINIVQPYLFPMDHLDDMKDANIHLITLIDNHNKDLIWDFIYMTTCQLKLYKNNSMDTFFAILPQCLAFVMHCVMLMKKKSNIPLDNLAQIPILIPNINCLSENQIDDNSMSTINIVASILGIGWLGELINFSYNNTIPDIYNIILLFFNYNKELQFIIQKKYGIEYYMTHGTFHHTIIRKRAGLGANRQKKASKIILNENSTNLSNENKDIDFILEILKIRQNTLSLPIISDFFQYISMNSSLLVESLSTLYFIVQYIYYCLESMDDDDDSVSYMPSIIESLLKLFLILNNIPYDEEKDQERNYAQQLAMTILDLTSYIILNFKFNINFNFNTKDMKQIYCLVENMIKDSNQINRILDYLELLKLLNENLKSLNNSSIHHILNEKIHESLLFNNEVVSSKNVILKKFLLKVLENDHNNDVAMLTHIVNTTVKWCESDKNTCEIIPILNKKTFVSFFSVAIQVCSTQISNYSMNLLCIMKNSSNNTNESYSNDSLSNVKQIITIIEKYIELTSILVDIIKINSDKNILKACIKHCTSIVNVFNRKILTFFGSSFLTFKDMFLTCIRKLQHFTRVLHHICHHAKANKDMSLAASVPLLKKSLEQLVFGVKTMLEINHCGEAFWMGNLKNKDLKGQEIISQHTPTQQQSSSNISTQISDHSIDSLSDKENTQINLMNNINSNILDESDIEI